MGKTCSLGSQTSRASWQFASCTPVRLVMKPVNRVPPAAVVSEAKGSLGTRWRMLLREWPHRHVQANRSGPAAAWLPRSGLAIATRPIAGNVSGTLSNTSRLVLIVFTLLDTSKRQGMHTPHRLENKRATAGNGRRSFDTDLHSCRSLFRHLLSTARRIAFTIR